MSATSGPNPSLHRKYYSGLRALLLRISAQRGRPFQPIVDGISDERGRRFKLNVDDVSA